MDSAVCAWQRQALCSIARVCRGGESAFGQQVLTADLLYTPQTEPGRQQSCCEVTKWYDDVTGYVQACLKHSMVWQNWGDGLRGVGLTDQ